jgi:hypothetical protein
MKSFWKKGVLDWRRDNPSGALTKEHVASILQRVLKHIKPEIICHGFRANGLYPWNPDAVDYSKCLGKNKKSTHVDVPRVENKQINENCVIRFLDFEKIVGQEKIGIFQNINTEDDNIDDENFLILYQLYKKFTKNSNKQNVVPDSVPDVNPVTVQEEVEAETSRIIEDTEYFDISNIPIIFSTSPGIGIDLQSTDIPHTPRSSVEVLTETIVGTEEFERISLDIDLIPDSIEFNNNDWNETADNESTLTMANVKKTEEIFATKYDETEKVQIESTNKNVINEDKEFIETYRTKKLLKIKNSPIIRGFLNWPATPERKGKSNKKQTEKLPFVLTSAEWQNIQIDKKQKKNQTELEKEERKRKRMEKSKTISVKNVKPKNKKQKTAKDTTNKICDNVDLKKKSPIKKTPIQEVTKQLFPIEDTKKVVVLSNIELPKFQEEDLNNILGELGLTLEKNPIQTFGLCFGCTNNLTKSNYGLQCLNCKRQYHVKCMKRLNLHQSNDNKFECLTCLTLHS